MLNTTRYVYDSDLRLSLAIKPEKGSNMIPNSKAEKA